MLELDAVHQLSGVSVVQSLRAVVCRSQEHLLPEIVEVVDARVKIRILDGSPEKSGYFGVRFSEKKLPMKTIEWSADCLVVGFLLAGSPIMPKAGS